MVTTVQVRGKILGPNLLPAAGSISFQLSTTLRDAAGNVVYTPSAIGATLDTTGSFAVTLIATNDSTLQPAGAVYTVTESFQGSGQTYSIQVPTSAAGAGLELADVIPVTPGPQNFTYALASDLTGKVTAGNGVSAIVSLTQAAYDALATKVATTLYVIT